MSPRGKIVLARINNETKRRASLKKRRAGLLKKVSELTQLCDAKAAVVVYSPGDDVPTVWPSPSEAREIISKFQRMPVIERMAISHTATSFLDKKLMKEKKKAEKLTEKKEERYAQALLASLSDGKIRAQDLDLEQRKKLGAMADEKKKELLDRIQKLKGKKQQASHLPQVLPPSPQMPLVSRATSGLNRNGLAGGRNLPPPPAAVHGQQLNLSGKTLISTPFPSYLTSDSPVMSPNTSAANRLYGNRDIGAILQHPLAYPASMAPPNYNLTETSTRPHIGKSMFENMIQAPRPSFSPTHLSPNRFNTRRLCGQTNHVCRTQHSLPSSSSLRPATSLPPPKPLSVSHARSAVSHLDKTKTALINGNTRAFNGKGECGMKIKNEPTLHLPLTLPPRLGLPPRLPVQSESSGFKMTRDAYWCNAIGAPVPATTTIDQINSADAYTWSTNRFPAPATMVLDQNTNEFPALDQSNFGVEYTWNMNGFPAPATAALDQSNFGNESRRNTNKFPASTAAGQSKFCNEYKKNMNGFPARTTTVLDQRNFRDEHMWNMNGYKTYETAALDQINFGDGTTNEGYADVGISLEANNAPPFYSK